MAMQYIGRSKGFKVPLEDDNGNKIFNLIWGDPVHEIERIGDRVKVTARRDYTGWLDASCLADQGLLELYIIDVGQGDGVLLRTPNDKWHLVDAGVASIKQMTKKGTANFLRWKFINDLRNDKISLANVIVTHPDSDHYGGLLDLFSGHLFNNQDGTPDRTFEIEVENYYHSGIPCFKGNPPMGVLTEGEVAPFPHDGPGNLTRTGKFVTELLNDKDTFANPVREFDTEFERLAELIVKVPQNVSRLSHLDQHLPGYGPQDGDVTISVLGPVLEEFAPGMRGLRYLQSESVTRNGHSIVLRLDYGQARILLTGDLNSESHRLLLRYYEPDEFAVDVAKACHHGAKDIEFDFLKAMKARATVASSGDNEAYSHPRPAALGASARYGREALDAKGKLLPPLLYSTELARSIELSFALSVQVPVQGDDEDSQDTVEIQPNKTKIKSRETDARFRRLPLLPLATDLIYGLVNVRTDGQMVMCATMLENGIDFDVEVFRAGVDPPA
ncbi:MAG TPA: MBL fold metallo-hydrolase [Chloroflexia bacterium]|jgi:beta-lactamase superfamily II metal-dependent hydrolase